MSSPDSDFPRSEPSPAGLELVGELLDGRYRVLRVLGRGMMGRVWLAQDERLAREVVLKIPLAALLADDEFRVRFEREMRELIRNSHPGVVTVFDCGRHRGAPYVVMEHMGGGTLKDRLDQRPLQSLAEVLAWAVPIAAALDALHARGTLHRDVKPANILFDEHGAAKLADFGIVKAIGARMPQMTVTRGLPPGSPAFMAPEATGKEPLTPAYDQYALAVTVYGALSNAWPHDGDTDFELLTNKRTQPPRSLASVNAALPASAVAAVMRALATDPGQRFGSCAEFVRALDVAAGAPQKASGSDAGEARPVSEAASSSADRSSGVARGEATYAPSAWTRARAGLRVFASPRRGVLLAFALLATAAGWWLLGGAPKSADESVGSAASSERASEPQSQPSAARASPAAAKLTLTSPQEDTRYESESDVIVRIRSDVALSSATVERVAMLLDPDDRGATAKLQAPAVTGMGARDTRWTLRAVTRDGVSSELAVRFTVDPKRSPSTPKRGKAPDGWEVLDSTPGWEGWAKKVRDNRTGIVFLLVEPGTFWMGSPDDEVGRSGEEYRHQVTLTRGFYLGETEVTVGQWRKFAATGYVTLAEKSDGGYAWDGKAWKQDARATWKKPLPDREYGFNDRHPVTQLAWLDVAAYAKHFDYRLPTEAELEFVIRAGTSTRFWWGETEAGGRGKGNFADESGKRVFNRVSSFPFDDGAVFTSEVGRDERNAWGFADLLGNVWEWCEDAYNPNYYRSCPKQDPCNRSTNESAARVVRGGSWGNAPANCRSASRGSGAPSDRNANLGFRVARTL